MEHKTVTLSRHLALIAIVLRQPGITVAALAELLALSPEQLRRQVRLLDEVGVGDLLPGEALFFDLDLLEQEDRVSLTYHVDAIRTPDLTHDEITYLTLGLARLVGQLSNDELTAMQEAASAMLALAGPHTANLPLADIGSLLRVIESDADNPHYSQVSQALEETRTLDLVYVDANGNRSSRTVEPLSLVQTADGWTFNAWCRQSAGSRSFRLDRIIRAEVGDQFSHSRRPVPRGRRAPECRVTLRSDAGWTVGELPTVKRTDSADGITVTFEVFDEQWMITQLILLSPYVLQVEPHTYLIQARNHAQQAARVWQLDRADRPRDVKD